MLITAKKSTLVIVVGLAMLAGAYFAIFAGNMEPPGPPAPTMKTLDDVEPRIPIRAADLPLTITQPGSYYLVENITTTGGGISISVASKGSFLDGVTIDLMGHTLEGGTGSGISGDSGASVVVKDGVVKNWASTGVALGTNSQVINVRATGNGNDGIVLSSGSIARGCLAYRNSGNGFRLANDAIAVNCIAASNAVDGFFVSARAILSGCKAEFNTGDGFDSSQSVTGGQQIFECTADQNLGNGIVVRGESLIRSNRCARNTGAGILVLADAFAVRNRIEGNHVIQNSVGIDVDTAGSLIIKNSASGNTTDYDIVAGNDVGSIVLTPVGAGAWDNFRF